MIRDGIMYVTLGRNDRSGYAMIMNLTGFVDSMRPVRTKIQLNTFFKHISVSAAEQGKGVSGGHNLNAGRKVSNDSTHHTKRRDLTKTNSDSRSRNLRSLSTEAAVVVNDTANVLSLWRRW